MRVTLCNNSELVIQARNDADFALATKVVACMRANGSALVVAAEGAENGGWIQLTNHRTSFAADDYLNDYKMAKAEVTGKQSNMARKG